MNNKRFKKVLAGMLATTMVLGMSVTAFAATGDETGNGTGTGTGTFEGHVDKDVISITLPTADATTFSYIMDPEGLIAATEGANHSGSTFEDGANVFFTSAANTYTSKSASLKVINKGTVAVDVTVSATTAANDDVAMADSDTFAEDNKAAQLYLGLNVAGKDAKAIKTAPTDADVAADATVTVGLSGNDANYEVKPNETGTGYVYAAKENVADTAWNSFEFYLTGKCNPNGDYSTTDLSASDVTVTWSYAVRATDSSADLLASNASSEPVAAAPSIATTSYTAAADTAVEVPVDLGSGDLAATGISSVTYLNKAGETKTLADSDYTFEDAKLTLTAATVNVFVNSANDTRTYTITFNDSAATTASFTLSK